MDKKLEEVAELVTNALADPDLDIEYTIPDDGEPVFTIKYSGNTLLQRQVRLKGTDLKKTPQDMANMVTFFIEQFKEEVDSLNYGAQ